MLPESLTLTKRVKVSCRRTSLPDKVNIAVIAMVSHVDIHLELADQGTQTVELGRSDIGHKSRSLTCLFKLIGMISLTYFLVLEH